MATIGVPAEIKRDERRVALTPDGVRELISQGMEVRVQAGAGLGAGITALAYETVQLEDGSLPLLAPMSEVAWRPSGEPICWRNPTATVAC
jgi:alanine dehydrogenase